MKEQKRTTAGPDGIPYWVYRENCHLLAETCCFIFNWSLKTGDFPESWKTSKIIPLQKTRSASLPKEFRPVAITNIVSRCFERIIFKYYVKEKYESWASKNQFGFRSMGSTTAAGIKILNDVYSYNHYDYARIIALDMSKAFDTLSHQSIISGMVAVEPQILPQVINWVASFLKDRRHYTVYRGIHSSQLTTNQGAPQGTVGAPTLYGIATNSVSSSHCTAKLTIFADDNTPVMPGNIGTNDGATEMIRNLETQFKQLNLQLNTAKSKEVVVKFKKNADASKLSGVTREGTVTILGIKFDEQLSFQPHVNEVVKRCNSLLYMLQKLKHLNYTRTEIQMLYDSLVVSRMRYGLPVWAGTAKGNLQKIDGVQRKAKRMGLINTYIPIEEIARAEDEKLFNFISRNGRHPLSDYIPKRTEYSNLRLRQRRAAVQMNVNNKTLSIFPNRILKKW